MLNKASQFSMLSVAVLGLICAASITLLSSSKAVANSPSTIHTLSCIGKLGNDTNNKGMRVSYDSFKNTAIISFMKYGEAKTPSRGSCVLKGTPWNATSVGKFCHFGVDDVIYKKNLSSMNIISRKAPYLLKILKTGQAFSLRVRSGDSRCPHGLTVVN